jgi:hypothetical protein
MIEILKCALAAAKLNERHQTIAESYYWLRQYKLLAEKAIAELESQEPDVVRLSNGTFDVIGSKIVPLGALLYLHTPQRTEPLIGCVNHDCAKCKERTWVGLTDEELMQTMSGEWTSQFYFARAVEAKLKEKNT